MPTFYEFFAGGGMVRAGLGPKWQCLCANDCDSKKARAYRSNWGYKGEFRLGDIREIRATELPDIADLAWASFPCQDLSLAGAGAGLEGKRSGTFWPFWQLISDLAALGRAPRIVCLENVCGTLTSHKGHDFAAICQALGKTGYSYGAVVMDAKQFLPQSRPRLFIVGIHDSVAIPSYLRMAHPQPMFHTAALQSAVAGLSTRARQKCFWLNLPQPRLRSIALRDVIDFDVPDRDWHSRQQTQRLLSLMSPINKEKVALAAAEGFLKVGTIYRRTRVGQDGIKQQRAEVRFDNVAGCLRTSAGGSSRQIIICVEGDTVRTRLLTSREAARLMGISDSYKLPSNYNEAYHLIGDGVAVPVVRHLAKHVFEPLIASAVSAAA